MVQEDGSNAPSPLKPGFDSMTAHMGFMVNKVPLGQSLSPSVCGSPVDVTPVVSVSLVFIYHRCYTSILPATDSVVK